MSDDSSLRDLLDAGIDGIQAGSIDRDALLSAFRASNYPAMLKEAVAFLRELVLNETPSDPAAIKDLSKQEVRAATYRVNFFERLRVPAHDDEQLEHLYARAQELWGEYPTEPVGRWVEWCLWVHLHRRRHDGSFSEVVFGDANVADIRQAWADRHEAREWRRRRQKVNNYAQYDTSENVPSSIRHWLMQPFLSDDDVADIEVTGPPAGPMMSEHER